MNLFEMINYPERKCIDEFLLCLYCIQVLLFLNVILNKRLITKPELVNCILNISSSVGEAIIIEYCITALHFSLLFIYK